MEAIIGLIGVIVGGLVSAVASYLGSRSLEGRRVAAHRRAAARLVNLELKRAALTLSQIRGVADFQVQGRPEPKPGGPRGVALKRADWTTLKWDLDERLPKVTSEVWETHQEALAEALSDSEWDAVESAYEAIGSVQWIDSDVRGRSEETDLTGQAYRLAAAVEAITKARSALKEAAGRQSA